MPKLPRIPSYCKHKSGQARVIIAGRTIYLGKYDTPESREAYKRLIAQWLDGAPPTPPPQEQITVNDIVLAHWKHVQEHYRKPDGRPTSEVDLTRRALKCLRSLYGTTPAAKFGPLALKAVRQEMIRPTDPAHGRGWCRKSINLQVHRIKRMFKWATENELIPPSVFHGLQAVAGLRSGRSGARETVPTRPVPAPLLGPVLELVSDQVHAMIRLQLLTAMRPGEVCIMRGCDLDTTRRVWIYRPESHKTQHHGKAREIYIGPQAQDVLKPFLQLDTQAYLFSPAQADEAHRTARRQARKTPLWRSHLARLDKKRAKDRRRPPRAHYDVASYRRAIARACEKAFPIPDHLGPGPGESRRAWRSRLSADEWATVKAWRRNHTWHPHQLRHNAATELRREFGIELARIILGHRHGFTTEIYAEADRGQAMEVIAKIG